MYASFINCGQDLTLVTSVIKVICLSLTLSSGRNAVPVADLVFPSRERCIGESKGARGMPPSGSIFFQFHAVFVEF